MSKITAREAAEKFRKDHADKFTVNGKEIHNIAVGYGVVDFFSEEGDERFGFDDKVTVKSEELDGDEGAKKRSVSAPGVSVKNLDSGEVKPFNKDDVKVSG